MIQGAGLADLACMCNRKLAQTGLGGMLGDDFDLPSLHSDYVEDYGGGTASADYSSYDFGSSGSAGSSGAGGFVDAIGGFFSKLANAAGNAASSAITGQRPTLPPPVPSSSFSTANIVKYATVGVGVLLGVVVLKRVLGSKKAAAAS